MPIDRTSHIMGNRTMGVFTEVKPPRQGYENRMMGGRGFMKSSRPSAPAHRVLTCRSCGKQFKVEILGQ